MGYVLRAYKSSLRSLIPEINMNKIAIELGQTFYPIALNYTYT